MNPIALAVSFAIFALFVCVWGSTLYATVRKRGGFWTYLPVRIFALLTLLASVFAVLYGFFIEPYSLTVTDTGIKMEIKRPLVIVHLSDIHYEGARKTLERLAKVIETTKPDVVCITGDYFNREGDTEIADMRNFIERISKFCGAVLSVSGNWDNPLTMEKLFENSPSNVYHETFVYETEEFAFVLLPFGLERFLGDFAVKTSERKKKILVTHTPDLIEACSNSGLFCLYLCGHTHGGQVRLPLIGPLLLPTKACWRYQSGFYTTENGMYVYINRGVGMTSVAPRMRFFCPPEIAIIRLFPIK